VLVRRVKQGSVWHPTTDYLAGTAAAYGDYGSSTYDSTFGIPYAPWVDSTTEFLFMTGLLCFYYVHKYVSILLVILGDRSTWLITTWDEINNGGQPITADDAPRKILKSSASPTAASMCLICVTLRIHLFFPYNL
jgi:hypothetical protein